MNDWLPGSWVDTADLSIDPDLRPFDSVSRLRQNSPKDIPVNTKHLYDFIQCWTNVEDVGPTLYKCYTNVLCLLGSC